MMTTLWSKRPLRYQRSQKKPGADRKCPLSGRLRYRPLPLRWPFLLALNLSILGVVALLELSHRSLSVEQHSSSTSSVDSSADVPWASSAVSLGMSSTHSLSVSGLFAQQHQIPNPTDRPSVISDSRSRRWSFSNTTAIGANGTLPGSAMGNATLASNRTRSPTNLNDRPSPSIVTNVNALSPSQYAQSGLGPISYVTWHCAGTPVPPGQVPVLPDSWMLALRTLVSAGPCADCNRNSLRGYYTNSSDPSAGLLYWTYLEDADLDYWPAPWLPLPTEPEPQHWAALWDLSTPDMVLKFWQHSLDSNACARQRCAEACAGSRIADGAAPTTTFQIVKQTTDIRDIVGTAHLVTQVYTRDGRPVTEVQTEQGLASLVTVVGRKTVLVTATYQSILGLWIDIGETTIENGYESTQVNGNMVTTVPAMLSTQITRSNWITATTRPSFQVPTATPLRSSLTLMDSDGVPTATVVETIVTMTGSDGLPIATLTAYEGPSWHGPRPQNASATMLFVIVDERRYFLVEFLPLILATLLSIPIGILKRNIELMLPFQALSRPSGAPAKESICSTPGGLTSPLRSFRLIFYHREPLSLLGDLMILVSSLLTSVSAETVGTHLYGKCSQTDFHGCVMGMSTFTQPTRIAQGLCGGLSIILALAVYCCHRTKEIPTGLNPWSIATLASLLSSDTTRQLVASAYIRHDRGKPQRPHSAADLVQRLAYNRIALRKSLDANGPAKYELVVFGDSKIERSVNNKNKEDDKKVHKRYTAWTEDTQKMHNVLRSICLAVLCGLLVLILYYELTMLNTGFENFMDNNSFGVRFLFSGLGVGISLFWSSFFSRLSMMQVYNVLSRSPPSPASTLALSPTTSVFSGLVRAVRQRDIYKAVVAFTGMLAIFLPIPLSNIPFHVSQTWLAHLVCAWLTVGILGLMILVLVWSYLIKYPQLPIAPDTIMGNLYYLCDSPVLRDFEGMSGSSAKEWRASLKQSKKEYRFGWMWGLSCRRRIGVDYG